MTIQSEVLRSNGSALPSIVIRPEVPLGYAVVTHGYGGCKEEVLGLAWHVAFQGLAAVAIDLRGHGENERVYDADIFDDVKIAVGHCQKQGKVVAIGHSLGGRLCLLSKADYKIALSPAPRTVSPQTQKLITEMRAHRVREVHGGINFEALQDLPHWDEKQIEKTLILYCSRDVPEIMHDCEALAAKGARVELIEKATHGDIILDRRVTEAIEKQIRIWFHPDACLGR